MSTFSKAGFNALAYSASRPSYPPALYSHIVKHHGPAPTATRPTILVDLGCGPGLSTFEFVGAFDRVIGVDPGAGMVNAARDILAEKRAGGFGQDKEVRFEQGKSEDLSAISWENEVDLVVAGQSPRFATGTVAQAQVANSELYFLQRKLRTGLTCPKCTRSLAGSSSLEGRSPSSSVQPTLLRSPSDRSLTTTACTTGLRRMLPPKPPKDFCPHHAVLF